MDANAIAEAGHQLAEQIRPMLAGVGPRVQGATLTLLLATYLRGFPLDTRNQVYNAISETTFRIVDDMEKIDDL